MRWISHSRWAFVGDVHEFDAERAAIGRPELVDQIAKRAVERTLKIGVRDPLVHVGIGSGRTGKVEQGMAWPVVAERIEVGDEMAQLAIGMNQVFGFDTDPSLGGIGLVGRFGKRRLSAAARPPAASKPAKNACQYGSTDRASD